MKNLYGLKILMWSTAVCLCAAWLGNAATAQIATGGNYTLTQTATASGGASGAGASTGGNYSIEGTVGQAAAGTKQTSGSYNFQPGFWTAQPILAPTAAEVTVGGRVLTADGRGIRNVRVIWTDRNGETRTVISGAFGHFRFTGVAAGETYIFNVAAKRYQFSNPTQVRTILEETNDLNFVAVPAGSMARQY